MEAVHQLFVFCPSSSNFSPAILSLLFASLVIFPPHPLCECVCARLYTYVHTANTRRLSELSAATPPSAGQQRELQLCLIFQSSIEQFDVFSVFSMMLALQENRWWTKYLRGCELSHSFLLLSEHSPSSAKTPRRLFSFLLFLQLYICCITSYCLTLEQNNRNVSASSASSLRAVTRSFPTNPPACLLEDFLSLLLWLVPVFLHSCDSKQPLWWTGISNQEQMALCESVCRWGFCVSAGFLSCCRSIVTLVFTHVWFFCPVFQPPVCCVSVILWSCYKTQIQIEICTTHLEQESFYRQMRGHWTDLRAFKNQLWLKAPV